MKNQLISTCVVLCALMLSVSGASADTVVFDWAVVANAGNAPDGTGGYGSVEYEYSIATTEVTNAQYVEFLNAVAKTDPYSLYNTNMSGVSAGIVRNGSWGSYTYSLKDGDTNWANRPVVYVSWYDTLRFANWLHNGQPTGLQNATTTEYGAYDMLQGASVVRLAEAKYWLPSENEWYKAAYYDPETGGYYAYATGSNILPSRTTPEDDTGNSAHYYESDYLLGWPYYTTEVGAYAESESPYGTYDQNGNVYEWNEALMGNRRGYRGGSWDNPASYLSKSFRFNFEPTIESNNLGFRVASFDTGVEETAIPEPTSLILLALGTIGMVRRMSTR